MARGDDPLHVRFIASRNRWRGEVTDGYLQSGAIRRRTVEARTEAECRAAKKLLLRQIADGRAAATGRATVRSWADEWLAVQVRRLRPATYTDYAAKVRRWVVPSIGRRRIGALTPADVRTVTTAVRAAGYSSTTAGQVQTVLTKMLRDAAEEGHPVPARLLSMKRPAKAIHDRTALPLDQAIAALRVAASIPDGSQWAAALLQGLRQGERLGLTWDRVDLDARTIDISWQLQAIPYVSGRKGPLRIPDGYEHRPLFGSLCLVRPKSARGYRIIPLVPWISQALTDWQTVAPDSPHGLVWPRPGGHPQTHAGDMAAWHTVQDLAGIRHPAGRYWKVHEMRHSTATLLMESGIDPVVITSILGHSSITTSRSYMHSDLTQSRRALEAVAGRLGLVAG